jgi:autophagy-related protein 11
MEIMDKRYGDLQDEVDRLRAQLGEEVLARQALSAELDERNRSSDDRIRDQEEQSDLVSALQVEMAQEKDRATDLGVRLQEALLDVDGLKNAEQTLLGQLQQMQDERSGYFQDASDAHADADELRLQVAGLHAELDAIANQLALVQQERDTALKSQSAESERLMRDRIAEADGDRAVLEHQTVTLNKQVEDLKRELDEKLSAVRNTAARQADGLKAELSLSKAQLREAQRREAVLSEEMAMLKDNSNALTSDRGHQAEVARDAVALVTKYYETCRPLLRILNAAAASKRTGSDEAEKDKQQEASPASIAHSTSSLRESGLVRSLASAQSFDLDGLTDAVNKVIIRSKRYQKGYKHMRDVSRSKITFTDFQRGDLVRTASALGFVSDHDRHYSYRPGTRLAASGLLSMVSENSEDGILSLEADPAVNAPHHFLKADEKMKEEAKSRDWIMARITGTEEAVAGEVSQVNGRITLLC